jgi:SNF2 family DNA or RNA helicase
VIALILKEIDQQSKFISANSDRAAVVVGNMDEPVKKQGATTSLSELFRQTAARRTGIVKYVEDTNSSSPSTLSYRAKSGGTLVVCPSSILTQ